MRIRMRPVNEIKIRVYPDRRVIFSLPQDLDIAETLLNITLQEVKDRREKAKLELKEVPHGTAL